MADQNARAPRGGPTWAGAQLAPDCHRTSLSFGCSETMQTHSMEAIRADTFTLKQRSEELLYPKPQSYSGKITSQLQPNANS